MEGSKEDPFGIRNNQNIEKKSGFENNYQNNFDETYRNEY